MSQKALVLHPEGRKATQVDVPSPSGQPGSVHAPDYRNCLPGADPDHLLAADCPFSNLTGHHVLVVYDANGRGPPNASASRLTTNMENGLEVEIRGNALVLYADSGSNFGVAQWEELDNVIYDELLEYFGQGLRPQAADIQRLVKDFKQGRFRYSVASQTNDEDTNKDDGGLPGWG